MCTYIPESRAADPVVVPVEGADEPLRGQRPDLRQTRGEERRGANKVIVNGRDIIDNIRRTARTAPKTAPTAREQSKPTKMAAAATAAATIRSTDAASHNGRLV